MSIAGELVPLMMMRINGVTKDRYESWPEQERQRLDLDVIRYIREQVKKRNARIAAAMRRGTRR